MERALNSGESKYEMNTEKLESGVYFYKLNVNGKTESVKKCLLLK